VAGRGQTGAQSGQRWGQELGKDGGACGGDEALADGGHLLANRSDLQTHKHQETNQHGPKNTKGPTICKYTRTSFGPFMDDRDLLCIQKLKD
jgi:hypothetical protein